MGYKELPEAHIITTNGCVGLVTNNAIEFLFCRKYPQFKGKAYSGVEKAKTKYISQGDKFEQILDVEESKQVQEFNEENVKCHPEYEMDGNIRIFYIFQTREGVLPKFCILMKTFCFQSNLNQTWSNYSTREYCMQSRQV